MDVLLFGGSFDPPHSGHLRLLRAALRALKPERAYIVPAFHSPLKPAARSSGTLRLRLVEAALKTLSPAERRALRVHPFELERRRKTYAFETVRFFRRLHPGSRVHFLIGSDSLQSLPRWKRMRELRRNCRFLVGRRPGPKSARPAGPAARFLPGAFPDISSTRIRARILSGEKVDGLVPSAVFRLIRRSKSYGLDIHEVLSRELSPERYRHTLCVAQAARALADRHGLDAEKAALAGLLHDCGRVLPLERMARYALRMRLPVPRLRETLLRSPLLVHAYVGEDLARRRFGVEDASVLSAVRKHTLGASRMSALDRLLYTADASSADRDFPEARLIRRKAREDLEAGFLEAVRLKLSYIVRRGGWLHPAGPALWNRLDPG